MSESAFDALCKGIKSTSHRMLDNIGITVSLADLPSYPGFSRCRDELFGTNFLNSVWRWWIRRYLFPSLHAKKETAYEDARHKIMAEQLNKIMDFSQDEIDANDPTST